MFKAELGLAAPRARTPPPRKALLRRLPAVGNARGSSCFGEEVAKEAELPIETRPIWGKAVAGFGDPFARIVIIGLAPEHTAPIRTGPRLHWAHPVRVFPLRGAPPGRAGIATGRARSERWARAFGRVHRLAGSNAFHRDNRPTLDEIVRCAPSLDRELRCLSEAGCCSRSAHRIPRRRRPSPRRAGVPL